MRTKNEIIYAVLERLNVQSDDSNISKELIAASIDNKRHTLIKQQYSKDTWRIPDSIKQEIVVVLLPSQKVEGYAHAGTVLTSFNTIPNSIEMKGKEGPLRLRLADHSALAVNIVSLSRFPYVGNNRYTAKMLYGTLTSDRRLMLTSENNKHKFLQKLYYTDVFENPFEAMQFNEDYDDSIEEWDLEYPIEPSMADTIIDLIVNDFTKTLQIPADNTNDAHDGRQA